MSTTDVLILIPLIPLTPVAITPWLPWERWLFEKAPQILSNFLGPYFLYAAFAAWHFRLENWAVVAIVVIAVGCFIAALVKKYS